MRRDNIMFRRWDAPMCWQEGTGSGVAIAQDAVAFAVATGTVDYTDPVDGTTTSYETATWTGPAVTLRFAVTEVVASWTADTPGGSFIRIELSGTTSAGSTTKWYTLGNWAADDTRFRRTSVAGQDDADGTVAADLFTARAGRALTGWRLRVTLLRPTGSADVPLLRTLGVLASALSDRDSADRDSADRDSADRESAVPGSTPAAAQGVVLDTPAYSQRIHAGQYPQWDGGGASWCSPTCTSMVLAYWGAGPDPDDCAWVDPAYAEPWVDHAARQTYDQSFGGCGNWAFNIAYAGRFGMRGFVTRLRSLNEAELFIAAGIPLIVSSSYRKGEVPGLDYDTRGHLMVLVGFTEAGDPVLNDPNAPTGDQVRRPVGRAEWEAAWLRSSGGIAYVIHPRSVRLPTPPAQANW